MPDSSGRRRSRLASTLSSPRLTVLCLAAMAALTAWGTVYQASHGLLAARARFFDSWYFLAGGRVPLPGAQTVFWLFSVNLVASLLFRFPRERRLAGLWLVHLGLLVLMIGGFAARRVAVESSLTLVEGESADRVVLPDAWEIVLAPADADAGPPAAFDLQALRPGQVLVSDGEARVKVGRAMVHSRVVRPRGPDGGIEVAEAPRQMDPARNTPAVELVVSAPGSPERKLAISAAQPHPTRVETGGQRRGVFLQRATRPLPFTLRLLDFEKRFYPQSGIPKSYSSRVEIRAGPVSREALISMNRPLRYADCTVYQSSYQVLSDGREVSIFSVACNPVSYVPYWATAVVFLGLVLHFAGAFRRPAAAVLAILVTGATAARADGDPDELSLHEFSSAPILEGGRVMPMDTFARLRLLQFSGRTTLRGQPAIRWLAGLLFDPERHLDDPVFLLSNPDAANALGLPADPPRRRHSFTDLDPHLVRLEALALRADGVRREDLHPADRELMRLHLNLASFRELPLGFQTPLVPPHEADGPWLTPREILARNDDPDAIAALHAFRAMAAAYQAGSQERFDAAARGYRALIEPRIAPPVSSRRLGIETRINRLAPFARAEVLYGLGLIAVLAHWAAGGRWFRRAGLAVLLAAVCVHGLGLTARALIMGRPPVTNLYSTFLFVSLVAALLGLAAERRLRNGLGLFCGSVGGFGLLLFSRRFEAGDTMHKVVAVLDSNLWLTAHVLTIMIGFAGCLMAGLVGHVYLAQAVRRRDEEALGSTYATMTALLGIGLIFTFLGTMLGGVWADQAWGRFWGWDPKENGALLVILWCAILFHARPANLLSRTGMAVGCVLLNVVVALAWLGVNLLGVGMHSYGWTSGVASALALFVAFELAFAALAGSTAALRGTG